MTTYLINCSKCKTIPYEDRWSSPQAISFHKELGQYRAQLLELNPQTLIRGPVPGKDNQVRMLISCDRKLGVELAAQLKAMTSARSAKHKGGSVNVRIDPLNL